MYFADTVKIDIFEDPDLSVLENTYTNVDAGGKWAPKDCVPWQKVAILIPYRDRYVKIIFVSENLRYLYPRSNTKILIFSAMFVGFKGSSKYRFTFCEIHI